jgi:hypothetical protein
MKGFEPLTYRLQGDCSSQLSYIGNMYLLKYLTFNAWDYTKLNALRQGKIPFSQRMSVSILSTRVKKIQT